MANLSVVKVNGQNVVDSRLIADDLGIEHKNFLATIRKYEDDLMDFGGVAFEKAPFETSGGIQVTTFCYLNEEQATYLMTLSRNTPRVRQCKKNLVKAFTEARKVIHSQGEYLRELELQNQILSQQLQLRQLDHNMLVMHGKETVLTLRGMADQLVHTETKTTEVVEPDTGHCTNILTAQQLKDAIYERTGQKIKSMKQVTDALRKAGRDDLLVPVRRSQVSEYVPPDALDEVINVVFRSKRQMLIGE
jgi:phage regulator Rha-like protein